MSWLGAVLPPAVRNSKCSWGWGLGGGARGEAHPGAHSAALEHCPALRGERQLARGFFAVAGEVCVTEVHVLHAMLDMRVESLVPWLRPLYRQLRAWLVGMPDGVARFLQDAVQALESVG